MDLYSILPSFYAPVYTHILLALERAQISLKELLVADVLDIAKRSRAPVTDLRNLTALIVRALQADLGLECSTNSGTSDNAGDDAILEELPVLSKLRYISTLDPILDRALEGGVSTGYVTELTGESGSGKTQILLHLLLSVQLPWPYGLSKRALYISTETDLPTVRLVQLLNIHPSIASLADDIPRPSLDNILSTTTLDLETQDHIIKFQVPIAVERYDVGLLVIDSIATNYRAEMSSDSPSVLLDRAWQLKQLGALLRALAAQRNIAIVISNQVADRFNDTNDFDDTAWAIEPAGTNPACSPSPQHFFSSSLGHPTSSSQVDMSDIQQCQSQSLSSPWKNDAQTGHGHLKIPSLSTILSLDYERSFVSGLGGHRAPTLEASWSEPAIAWKVPSLGVVWTNQISCRIMLRMEQTTKWSTQQENKQYPKPAVHACQTTRSAESQRAHEHEHKESIGNHLYDECCPSRLLFREAEEDTVPSMLSDQPLLYEAYTTSMSAPDNLIINQQRRRRTVHIVFCPWATGNPNQGHKPLDPLTNHGEQGTVGSNSDDGDAAFNREFDSMSFPIEIVIAGDGVHTVK